MIDGTGRRVDSGAAFHPYGQGETVAVRLRPGLGNAGYLASYRVVSADSHPVSGVVRFTVGGAGPVASVRGAGTAGTAGTVDTLMDGTRALSFLGLALLGGAWVLLLGRRRPDDPDDLAEPPEARRGWAGVVAGAVLAFLALAVELQISMAHALNDRGEVVGELQRPLPDEGRTTSAFVWRHGVMTDLGVGLGSNTQATGINNRGQVIGVAISLTPGGDKALLWTLARQDD